MTVVTHSDLALLNILGNKRHKMKLVQILYNLQCLLNFVACFTS